MDRFDQVLVRFAYTTLFTKEKKCLFVDRWIHQATGAHDHMLITNFSELIKRQTSSLTMRDFQ